jgi:hypothetical protein
MKDKANTTKRGERGKRGKRGYDGAKGIAGTNGTNGLSGTPGKNGSNGLPGKDAVTSDLVFSDCLLFLQSSGLLINKNYIPNYYANWNNYCSQMQAYIILTNAGNTARATDAVTGAVDGAREAAAVAAEVATQVRVEGSPTEERTTAAGLAAKRAMAAKVVATQVAAGVAFGGAVANAVEEANCADVDDAMEAAFYLLLQEAFYNLYDYYPNEPKKVDVKTGVDGGGIRKPIFSRRQRDNLMPIGPPRAADEEAPEVEEDEVDSD